MTDYNALITAELARLDHLTSSKTKRDATIRALAQADIDGQAATSIFTYAHTIGERTYYSKDKDYYHNEEFRAGLAAVTDLYRRRDNEERDALEAEARRKRHEERVQMIRMGKRLVTAVLVDRMKRIDQNEVPDMTYSELERWLTTVFDEERIEFDELPTRKTDVTSGGEKLEAPTYIMENRANDND
jgi:hypothetical protein